MTIITACIDVFTQEYGITLFKPLILFIESFIFRHLFDFTLKL